LVLIRHFPGSRAILGFFDLLAEMMHGFIRGVYLPGEVNHAGKQLAGFRAIGVLEGKRQPLQMQLRGSLALFAV
jgi:hypothetical protein